MLLRQVYINTKLLKAQANGTFFECLKELETIISPKEESMVRSIMLMNKPLRIENKAH